MTTSPTQVDLGSLYDATYFQSHCGPVPYTRSEPQWAAVFGAFADNLIRALQPARVLDVGCALGFLVEAFWDRGVEAWGLDISPYAVEQVRADVRKYCHVAVVVFVLVNVAVLSGTIIPASWRFLYDYPLRTDVSISVAELRMPAEPLPPGLRYAQSFVAHQGNPTKVEVKFATYSSRIAAGLLKMGRRQMLDCEDIASWTMQANTIKDSSFVGLSFPAMPGSKGKTYYIVLRSETRPSRSQRG